MPIFKSIKFQFLTLGASVLIAAIGMRLSVGIPFVRDQVAQLVVEQQRSIASHVAREIDLSIRTRQNVINDMATDLPLKLLNQPNKLSQWFSERHRANPLFSGLLLVSADGHSLLSEYPLLTPPKVVNFGTADWFRQAIAQKHAVLGKPMRLRAAGPPLIAMATPIYDHQGRLRAVLTGLALLDAPGFLDSMQTFHLGQNGGFLLISPHDRMLLAASDPKLILTAMPRAKPDSLQERAINGFRGSGITVDNKGVEQIATLVSVPSTGWYLEATMPTAEALRPAEAFARFSRRNGMVLLPVLALIFFLFLSYTLAPLVSSARAMRDMANGRAPLAPLPVNRQDEVGDLLRGFNYLVAKLHEKERTLHDTLKTLDQLASTDSLTGAWNRRWFNELASGEIERTRRYGHPLTIMLLDLDLFKKINDTHGHAQGDQVLLHVADCIRWILRKSDSLSRWGGEEFMILLPDTHLEQAVALAERVRLSIATQNIPGVDPITASIGVAAYRAQETLEQWVARADVAMYRAKKQGRNQVVADNDNNDLASASTAATLDFSQLVWTQDCHSGHPQLDAQHQTLFDYCNQLLTAIHHPTPDEQINLILQHLLDAVVQHCQDEQLLMQKIAYPYTQEHTARHHALLERALQHMRSFQQGQLAIGDLARFLANDLVFSHVVNEDQEFYAYLHPSLSPNNT